MSQISLNIYRRNPETRKRELDRTVTAETVFLPFGVVQDILEAIDVDTVVALISGKKIDDKAEKAALVQTLAPAIMGALREVTPLLLDVFPDTTEDEIRMCDTSDIARVVVEILTMAVKTMFVNKAKKKA